MKLCEHRRKSTIRRGHHCDKRHIICSTTELLLCLEPGPGIIAIVALAAAIATIVLVTIYA